MLLLKRITRIAWGHRRKTLDIKYQPFISILKTYCRYNCDRKAAMKPQSQEVYQHQEKAIKPQKTSLKVKYPENSDNHEIKSTGTSSSKLMTDTSSLVLEEDIFHYKKCSARHYSKGFPTPIIFEDINEKATIYWTIDEKKKYGLAIFAFGVENFFSYVAYFCKHEVRNDSTEIISIGSGDGTVDGGIVTAYRNHFGSKINITLVDKNPNYNVHFKTVDDLLKKRPNVIGNCILLIMLPECPSINDNYDIESIRRLQPYAALTLYDPTELSGNYEMATFLKDKNDEDDRYRGYYGTFDENHDFGLSNYVVDQVAHQEVHLRAGTKYKMFGSDESKPECTVEPGIRSFLFRLAKVTRTD